MLIDLARTRHRVRTARPSPEVHLGSAGHVWQSEATVETHGSPRGELVAGRYRVLRRIGRGGMGSVWLALDNQLSRPVALKALSAEPAAHGCGGAALREARAASAVSHPGVVQVYGLVVDCGREWIVMEALSGMTLRRTLRDSGALPPERVVGIGIRLLEALQSIHGAGLVHGDVKPGNVQLIATGNPVLIDFGLASRASPANPEAPAFVAGSPPYMAPEVIRSGVRRGASDLFSLGATLYEAATGCRPFAGATPVETAEAVLHSQPAPPLPGSDVGRVIEGLLLKDPRRRMDVSEAQTRLRGIDAGPSLLPGVPATGPAEPW